MRGVFIMYQNYYARGYGYRGYNGERFVVPFLLGGSAGGAAVGLTRPRPVYVNTPSYPYYPYYPGYGGYYNYSYGYGPRPY